MRTIEFSDTAIDQLNAAVSYYDTEQVGLGAYFVADLERLLARVCIFPKSCRESKGGSQVGITAKFKYKVQYKFDENRVVVHGLWHPARNIEI